MQYLNLPGSENASTLAQNGAGELLSLPSHLLERILADCGPGAAGAYASCRALRDAWIRALTEPRGAARYLLARFGHKAAESNTYRCPGFLVFTLSSLLRSEHGDAVLALLRAVREEVGDESATPVEALAQLLCDAAAVGHLPVVRWLLARGAADIPTALCFASGGGSLPVLEALLAAAGGGSPGGGSTASDSSQHSRGDGGSGGGGSADGRAQEVSSMATRALPHAAKYDDVEALRALLAAGADPRAERSFALHFAAAWGSEAAVEELLRAGADAAANDSSGLCMAAKFGHVRIVRRLLAAGADPRVFDHSPLALAVQHGCTEVVRALLGAGADPRARNGLLLTTAAREGRVDVAAALLEAGADPMAHGATALHAAAVAGQVGVLRLLLDWHRARAAAGGRRFRPLHLHVALALAARQQQWCAAQALAEAGGFAGWRFMPSVRPWRTFGIWCIHMVPCVLAVGAAVWGASSVVLGAKAAGSRGGDQGSGGGGRARGTSGLYGREARVAFAAATWAGLAIQLKYIIELSS